MKEALLWVDDEEARFSFERRQLSEEDGWEVVWAATVREAMDSLNQQTFKAVILDQDLPLLHRMQMMTLWGGCGILYWLRGQFERFASLAPRDVVQSWPPQPSGGPALNANRAVPVLIVSGFFNEEVLQAAQGASAQDWDIRLLSKPVEIAALRRHLSELLNPGGKR